MAEHIGNNVYIVGHEIGLGDNAGKVLIRISTRSPGSETDSTTIYISAEDVPKLAAYARRAKEEHDQERCEASGVVDRDTIIEQWKRELAEERAAT